MPRLQNRWSGRFPRKLVIVSLLSLLLSATLAACGGGSSGATSGGAVGWQMMRLGPGMMGYVTTGAGRPVRDLDAAARQGDRFGESLGLDAGEVMRFSNNYYVELLDRDGRRATEVLVDPRTGVVWIEYGPAMMWNARYGMSATGGRQGMMTGGWGMTQGGGMMQGGRYRGDPTWTPPNAGARAQRVSATEAQTLAEEWLQVNATGLVAGEAEPFPGYYTLHTLDAGKVVGMLSVNASTGAVWYHWWHGRFLGMREDVE